MASGVTRVLRSYIPEIELEGDWDKVGKVIGGLENAIAIGVEKGQKSAAEKILALTRKNIRESGASLGWQPVSPGYAKWKTSKGYDPKKLLMMSRTYYNNIHIWNKGDRYYVGLKHNIKNPVTNKGITVSEIANILERGDKAGKIKPRRLWAPTFKQFGGTAQLKKLIVWHVKNEIRNRLGVNAKATGWH